MRGCGEVLPWASMSGESSRAVVVAVVATLALWLVAVAGAAALLWSAGGSPPPPVVVGPFVDVPVPVRPADPPGPPAGREPLPAVPPVPPAGSGLSRHQVQPAEGLLHDLLRAEMQVSEASGRRLVVFFGTDGCQPCQAARRTLAAADVNTRLSDVQLVEVDVDAFSGIELHRAGAMLLDQDVEAIPLFCALRSRQPPVCIDGGAWGEDTDANIRSVLVPFLVSPPSGVTPRAPDRVVPI